MNIQKLSLIVNRQQEEKSLDQMIKKLSQRVMQQINKILDEATTEAMQKKYGQSKESASKILSFLDFLISFLINQLQSILSEQKTQIYASSRTDILEQYEILEEAVQKSQAEIRKHIRIQQQFRIHLEGLEQKYQQLQKKCRYQQIKYSELADKLKEIQKQKRLLQQKIEKYEQKNKINPNMNEIFANSRIYKDAFISWKYTISKNKKQIQKSNERIAKAVQKKSIFKKVDLIDRPNEIYLSNSIMKKPSNPNIIPESRKQSFKVQTLQMKRSKNLHNKKCAMFNFRTQTSKQKDIRLYRSNSVCS